MMIFIKSLFLICNFSYSKNVIGLFWTVLKIAQYLFHYNETNWIITLQLYKHNVYSVNMFEWMQCFFFFFNCPAKQMKQMTKDGFLMYLSHEESDLFNPAHKPVYQDMRQPLNHYFISSSHNTYLMEDQLKGPSSTEAYIKYEYIHSLRSTHNIYNLRVCYSISKIRKSLSCSSLSVASFKRILILGKVWLWLYDYYI